ncbi:unnamed protein product [Schistosoma mattheei]|uniref:Uncharacterized protein n=1 Tax=Schistosoma mattheei TaxID=31246 RepID=A0AA85BE65_9TREM|nr:unnamed protein product [Schistosoma mattheei]
MCITSNDNDTHNFKVNGCRNKSSIIGVSGEPALIEEKEETTPTVNEADLRNELRQTTNNTETHLNVTTETNENEEQKKSRNYSYIIVPVVVTFIVVCIGCVIGLWFYRKKRSMP